MPGFSSLKDICFLKRYGGTLAMGVMWSGFFLVVAAHGVPQRLALDLLALFACGLGAAMVLLYG